jgi:hypothetical protein
MYGIVVLAHMLGALLFILAHAVSMVTAFRLRAERDHARIGRLLRVSGTAIGIMYIGLLALVVAGVVAGFMGGHWGRLWIWTSLAILVAVIAAMYTIATPFYGRMRAAAGLPGFEERAAKYDPPATSADLAELATSTRPYLLAAIGGIGLVAIIWLLYAKPF